MVLYFDILSLAAKIVYLSRTVYLAALKILTKNSIINCQLIKTPKTILLELNPYFLGSINITVFYSLNLFLHLICRLYLNGSSIYK